MSSSQRVLRTSGALLLALGVAGAGYSTAQAETVQNAITDVHLDETTASTWSELKLSLEWAVPDGTRAGDTFSLTLPKELAATDGMTFALRDDQGSVVAHAVVSGSTVTFTMTDYAQQHVGVHGSAWLWVHLAPGVQPGEGVPLVFTVDGKTWRDTVTVVAPGPDDPGYPVKWQTWKNDATGAARLLWAVDGPVVKQTMVGQTYQIVDTPGPGQAIDCDAVHIFTGNRTAGGGWNQAAYIVRSRATDFNCSPSRVSVTLKPESADVGHAIRLLGESTITESLDSYTNRGVVSLWGTVDLPVSSVIKVGGGGVGTGTTPTTPAPTTTTPTSPTSTTTSPEPTTSTTSPEPTTSTTGPEPTVASPGQPGPSTSTSTTTSPEPTTSTTGPEPTVTSPGQPEPSTSTSTTRSPSGGSTSPSSTSTTSPRPTVTSPGRPATTTSPSSTVTTSPSSTATSSRPTVSGGSPAPAVTSPGRPATTVTITPAVVTTTVAGGTPALSGGGRAPVGGVVGPDNTSVPSPSRIDTGVPAAAVNPLLAGSGGLLAAGGGLVLLGLSGRRPGRRG